MSFALSILSSVDREAYGFSWVRKGIARACPSLYPTTEIPHFTGAVLFFDRDEIEAWGIAPRWRPFFPPWRPTQNP